MPKDNPSDKVYTPKHIVNEVLEHFGIHIEQQHTIMEPFRGDTSKEDGGNFYKALSKYSNHSIKWCEIDEGRDFFEVQKKVDWIITNPPIPSSKRCYLNV